MLRKLFAGFTVLSFFSVWQVAVAEESCYMCEVIKERNKNAPPPKHEYYEDYIKELEEEGKKPPECDIQFDDETPPPAAAKPADVKK